ncbi:CRISPR-associated Cas1 family protein [Sulfobacillus acidophilus TPY]|nr:CRISPR-associated Cas1 family protein [Sulfobacillus acidophilus TPY]
MGAIYIHGEVSFNKRFLEFLADHEIILHYLNHYGYYIGSFYPREHYASGHMTLKQAAAYLDGDQRRFLARAFVMGASRNMGKVLEYYHRRGKPVEEIRERMAELEVLIAHQESIDQLMAIEGNIRDLYFDGFDHIVERTEFRWEGRSRRPPTNALNALVSFGNTLMYTTVLSEIYKTHLDPRIGYLHATNHRRFSLNLDVAEIFKPILVDRLIFTLINKRMITVDQFQRVKGGIIMDEAARKTFVSQYDEKLRAVIFHRKSRRNISYRRLIRMELYKLEKHLLGESIYDPFVALW